MKMLKLQVRWLYGYVAVIFPFQTWTMARGVASTKARGVASTMARGVASITHGAGGGGAPLLLAVLPVIGTLLLACSVLYSLLLA